jgi:hypothetical protein
MIEALWSVAFSSQQGAFGSGVVVFETGRIFGGDSLYYYLGDYTVTNSTVRGSVNVIHYSGPPMNIFGPVSRMTLQFEGTISGDSMQATGIDPTNSSRRVGMAFNRLANLPQ